MNDSLNKDTNTDSYRAVNDNSYAYDFLSAVHNNPNLALQYDKFKRSSFLIRFGLIDLMIISAKKRRFHCCMIHFLKSFSMEMNTERDYQDL